ncbi:MAG: proliferating cell nuclear antigen (pcna) [Candidatus Nanohaloarchaea archaeon]|nr:proliferating cell nuclear antigen (pcna) [Candidatus Nanohaloarchaea archaeon]
MFKAELNDTKLLKDSLQAISNLISEGRFKVREDGLNLVAADPAMVALVDFSLEKDAFDSYEVDEEGEIGVNLEKLYSILRRANSDDTVTLELDDESKLVLKMENNSTRTFSIPLLNIDDEDVPSTDNLKFSVEADFRSSVFSDGVGDAQVVGDSVTIEADGEAVTIRAEGDNSNAEFRIEKGSDGLMELSGDGTVKSMFSLDYLNKMMKAEKLSDTMTVRLGDDFPMRMDFEVPDKLKLGFILAPRIEEE